MIPSMEDMPNPSNIREAESSPIRTSFGDGHPLESMRVHKYSSNPSFEMDEGIVPIIEK
jgi:hypothetical protein